MELEYIKQCEMAVEVQEAWTHDYGFVGDNVYFPREREKPFVLTEHLTSYTGCTWLPHQHQLQEMLIADGDDSITRYTELLTRFIGWYELNGWYEATIDQLWLAYFMHEKYSKRWNGTDWELIPPA